ncbi:MAG: WYL domain-containing protein [Gammaproteobacteria bacterium]|jgi:predicted DNA-binding transcriptional regulator YafY|nr:WYL domain-containing protein [Gammaproteobacteria bacterium]
MPEATMRQIEMLRLVPRAPRSITVVRLTDQLAGSGHEINLRTVQRDLNTLSTLFDLRSYREGRTTYWQWAEHAEMVDLPGMSPQTALTMFVVERFLYDQLPRSITGFLAQQFEQAREVLRKSGNPDAWMNKVRVAPRMQRLIQPKIDEEILRIIYDALIQDRKFTGRYLKMGVRVSREYTISPLGIVFRDGVTYLVATEGEGEEVLLFALHRFRSAEQLEELVEVPKGFKLDNYIYTQGPFDSNSGEWIKLEFKATEDVIQVLRETPLTHNQGLRPFEDSWVIVSVKIRETKQLKRWLLSFGSEVEVLEPPHLRGWVRDQLSGAGELYGGSD